MVGTVLLVVTPGFDDMALLANQVILEENSSDVIIASRESSAIKGQDSSVLTVSLDEAISHNVDYSAIVLIGGTNFSDWGTLSTLVRNTIAENKIIGAIAEGVDFLKGLHPVGKLSTSSELVRDGSFLTLSDPSTSEEFAKTLATML